MIVPHLYNSKRWLIQNIGVRKSGGSTFQGLLNELSLKELEIIRKHEYLIDRVKAITQMTQAALIDAIKEDHNLTVENYQTDDVWVGTEQIEDNVPKWFETQHCGWYLSLRNGEFHKWARDLLMQEVRINIWMRYLEHKKNSPQEQEVMEDFLPGMYL